MSSEREAVPLISEEWLKSVGFKWHQFDRQPEKQWLLWIGSALGDERQMFHGYEDLGVEVAPVGHDDEWFCWLRSDACHRYHRFIHIRHLRTQAELIHLIEGLTGNQWCPENNLYGSMVRPEVARREREINAKRLDRTLLRPNWHESEKDPDRGRPLVEHLDAAIKNGGAK